MGPSPLALGLLVNQELYRRLAPEAVMGQDRSVSQRPVGQFAVDGRQVVEEQVLVVVHELFLEGAIEAFGMRVHFRGTRIRPPMGAAPFVEALREVAEARRTVIGEEKPGCGGEQGTQRVEGLQPRYGSTREDL